MYNYLAVELNAELFAFIQTELGQYLFAGDAFFGGGRIVNCKAIAQMPTREDGYILGNCIFALICVTNAELESETFQLANLSVIQTFETAEEFSAKYQTC